MAQFNSNLSAPQGAGSTPQGVVGPVQKGGDPLLQIAAGLAQGFTASYLNNKKKEAEEADKRVVGSYIRDVETISQGYSSGQISASEANLRYRALGPKYNSAYPHLAESFSKAGGWIQDTSPIGEAMNEAKAIEDSRNGLIKEMASAGHVISPNESRESLDERIAAYTKTQQAKKELEQLMKVESHQASMDSSARQAYKFEQEQRSTQLVKDIANVNFKAFTVMTNDALARVRAGDNVENVTLEVEQQYSMLMSQISQVGDSPLADGFRKTFTDLKNSTIDSLTGKATAEQRANQLSLLQNNVALAYSTQNPQLYPIIALNKIAPNVMGSPFFQGQTDKIAHSIVSTLTDNSYVNLTEAASSGTFTNVLSGAIKQSNKDGDEDVTKQASQGLSNYFKSIGASSVFGMEPEAFNKNANFLASDAMRIAVEKGMVSQETIEQGRDTVQRIIEDPLVREVQKVMGGEFKSVNGPSVPITSVVDVVFEGNSVRFVAKGNRYMNPMTQQNYSQQIRELNDVAQAITKVVKIGAHVSGSTDYANYWESNKHFILPGVFDTPEAETNKKKVSDSLLDFIGDIEAPQGYGQVHSSNKNAPDVSKMSLDEVLEWQKGKRASAAGRYQFINKTLSGLKDELGLTGDEQFNPELQDMLAMHLLERRGLSDYQSGNIGREEFANRLAQEWASLPVVSGEKRGKSYYEGLAGNKSLTSVDDFLTVIDNMD